LREIKREKKETDLRSGGVKSWLNFEKGWDASNIFPIFLYWIFKTLIFDWKDMRY